MKASLVAYDFRELHKNLELKIIKHRYVKGCPNGPGIQIWLFEILGVKEHLQSTWKNASKRVIKY
jgi:hypothetical protein